MSVLRDKTCVVHSLWHILSCIPLRHLSDPGPHLESGRSCFKNLEAYSQDARPPTILGAVSSVSPNCARRNLKAVMPRRWRRERLTSSGTLHGRLPSIRELEKGRVDCDILPRAKMNKIPYHRRYSTCVGHSGQWRSSMRPCQSARSPTIPRAILDLPALGLLCRSLHDSRCPAPTSITMVEYDFRELLKAPR